MAPETELLLLCVSPRRRAERIRELCGHPLAWDALLGMAETQGVSALLYWSLKAIEPDSVPESLAARFRENTLNSVNLTSKLLEILEWMKREGIEVLPFKGPTLALMAYDNLALRQFLDLDLLVRREDAIRAREVLRGKGYRPTTPIPPTREADYLRIYVEFGMWGSAPEDPLIELQWGLTPRYFSVALDPGEFWGRAASVTVGNREVPALSKEDLLLVLAIHGAKHCWSRLSMVADVAWLMARGEIDWKAVCDRAKRLGCLRMLLVSWELARRLLGVELPMMVDRRASALAGEVSARMLEGERIEGNIGKSAWFHMRCRERWSDRWHYGFRLATTAGVEDWEFVELPRGLEFLYPLVRAPRLLLKYKGRTVI